MHLAMRLLIDGVVVVPDVVTGDELKRMSDAFEKRCGELGKRHMTWEEMEHIPDLVGYIGHPNLLAVVEPFSAISAKIRCSATAAACAMSSDRTRNLRPRSRRPITATCAPRRWAGTTT
jgi:hypothetical protein